VASVSKSRESAKVEEYTQLLIGDRAVPAIAPVRGVSTP